MPGGPALITAIATNPSDLFANGGASGGQQEMVVAGGGGSASGGGGVYGRNGLPVVVSGPPPHGPHGPLIRGNLVPRLLAPLPVGGGGAGGGGGMPLYAIVKPQSQPVVRQIGGGPPAHVCVPMTAQPATTAMVNKLGPATAPGNTHLLLLLCFVIPLEWMVGGFIGGWCGVVGSCMDG